MASNVTSDLDSSVSTTAIYLAPSSRQSKAPATAPYTRESVGQQLETGAGSRDLSAEARWQRARERYAEDAIVETYAAGYNKGGLLVSWLGLPGFVPASQLLGLERLHLEQERLNHLQQRQDSPLRLKIIEVDEATNRLIFSERATQVAASQRARLLQQIQVGERRTGQVTNLAEFGAFVDLGGVEGLIHLSQLSWRRLKHPSDVVRPGETVEVLVLSVDEEHEHVGLSSKQLCPDPWPGVEKRYRPGQFVDGTVSSIVSFGVFVLVEAELEGLLHVSEFGEEMEPDPATAFQRGDRVRASIIHVSEEERRLGLSLRAVEHY